MAEIAKKITATFSDIQEICRNYEKALDAANHAPGSEKKEKEDMNHNNARTQKLDAKNTPVEKKELSALAKPK